ncbi:N-acetylglucosamine kinase [Chitinophaga horti]|uniref:N-acetylglucosamine kinase n=1 Tax=Chitinophaga horti TaxID=2920382 RepID=A0ABY6J015_9BACT|nr:N-acetylglucosamine kinase [Chitinophaga horti]UYQ91584.1 N-acetylglucosamine kinase [Chitinophaga horti]
MPANTMLIADSGSTKTEWCLLQGDKSTTYHTQGISPYFQDQEQITAIFKTELLSQMPAGTSIEAVYFYGTGCASPINAKKVLNSLQASFSQSACEVQHDLMAAARGLCGRTPGVASILGTGSNSCYYDGSTIVSNNPGLGYVLGDEGSGTFLGKKILQYYLYHTFDDEMRFRFDQRFNVTKDEILDNVYRKPLANRYLASFVPFLAENRGHFMIENILEDGLNEFFFNHLYKYRESWTVPLHFTGGIAWHFKDVLEELCQLFELQLGQIMKSPMTGLVSYHREA